MKVQKIVARPKAKLSVLLLDWGCREQFQALDWLNRQSVPRDEYELVWIELYDKANPAVLDRVDTLITCEQSKMYHKHKGYNAGLLNIQAPLFTVCDSDALFPHNFVESILTSFGTPPKPLVLMHHEWRSSNELPAEGFKTLDGILKLDGWMPLWPNVGACSTFRREDAIRYGGFDENESYRGNLCGPYDLGWRLVNAGIEQAWHNEAVALFHFKHPHSNESANSKDWKEITYKHFEYHAWTAVHAFSTGRILPLTENPEIFKLRMGMRRVGSDYEKRYASMPPEAFTDGNGKGGWLGRLTGRASRRTTS